MAGGRPTRYKEEFAEQARKLCLLGFTDKKLADFFGVEERTINNWKKAHKEFFHSLTRGKDIADAEVAESYHKRAKGYQYKETTKESVGGELVTTKIVTKDIAPDSGACLSWLKNRQKEHWRDKQEIEQSGQIEIIELQTRFKKSTGK